MLLNLIFNVIYEVDVFIIVCGLSDYDDDYYYVCRG